MGKFEVQGIVALKDGLPYVQFFVSGDEEDTKVMFQVSPQDARDMANNIHEAATNAIYEAALLGWAMDKDPENGQAMAVHLISGVRQFRADKWGLPSSPEDWSNRVEENE